ncbi:MAG TPA: alpha-glucosidase/alpha-galactosidase [Verrucomicrobia bacterium]|nr:alpha-glucosidase/alpha-galactosidase [Verrucomicrobiota bacterium]
MAKITFMGAGSTVFVKNIIGDSMLKPSLHDAHIALYDIDGVRLKESKAMLDTLNTNINEGRATITAHLGVRQRRAALKGADYVINAIQVGGYEPCTVTDFEIPKRYGLRQTIADTIGIGGIFRALRTIPVMFDFADDMEVVCPNAWLLNYTNPMSILTGAMLRATSIRTVGLCHSVQGCARWLLKASGMELPEKLRWNIAGINHQSWLLEIADGGQDLYPEIKRRAKQSLQKILKIGGPAAFKEQQIKKLGEEGWKASHERLAAMDMIRLTMMLNFNYYITESSEHSAEYMPYWIKSGYPELIEQYGIPLDEYPRRCISQIGEWERRSREWVGNSSLTHTATHEYGASIMESIETDVTCRIGGNVMNDGLIENLPPEACVEVPCLVDRNGVQGCIVGRLPEQCAGLNRTHINVHLLTIEAAVTGRKDAIYQAAMLDPHTSAELPIDKIRAMCDDLIKAHGDYLPTYR